MLMRLQVTDLAMKKRKSKGLAEWQLLPKNAQTPPEGEACCILST